ncbi:MAG: hypothetical protein M3394_01920 [Actinomycetota bacterium]|nr:hypothetical protein [Actinomycetota bacterium]
MRWARLLLAVVLLGGCSGGRDDDTLPPPASSSTTVDYSVPAVIDVAYVEKVMEALDHVYGDAIRILAREREITPEFLEHLAAIYTEQEFRIAERAWVQDVAGGLPNLRHAPGDPATTVKEALRLDSHCVLIAVDRHFRQSRSNETDTPQKYLGLVPKVPNRDRQNLNPTPWMISFDGFVSEPPGAVPESPCGS